jgi:ATP-dependent Clp protease ATP-binding subunit ClpA
MGYEEGGQLTEAVRRKYSVIYWMRLKKSASDTLISTQVLDEGRLTDNKDVCRLQNYHNDSNMGSQIIKNLKT